MGADNENDVFIYDVVFSETIRLKLGISSENREVNKAPEKPDLLNVFTEPSKIKTEKSDLNVKAETNTHDSTH